MSRISIIGRVLNDNDNVNYIVTHMDHRIIEKTIERLIENERKHEHHISLRQCKYLLSTITTGYNTVNDNQ